VDMTAFRCSLEAAQDRDSPAPRVADSALMPCYLIGAFSRLLEVWAKGSK
jgi:hypothetical protein